MNAHEVPMIHKNLEPAVRSWAKELQLSSPEITIETDISNLQKVAEYLRKNLATQPIWFVLAPLFPDRVVAATPDAAIEIILNSAEKQHMMSVLSPIHGGGFTFDVSDGVDGMPVIGVAGWGESMAVIESIAERIEGSALFDSRIEKRG